jgi:hypothetical protein
MEWNGMVCIFAQDYLVLHNDVNDKLTNNMEGIRI